MSPRARRGAALIVAIAALLLCLPAARAQTAPTTLRLALGPVDVVTPLLYGVKGGVYAKYGLDVELVKLANGPGIAAAVAGGAVELAQAGTLAVVQAFVKGLPFTIIGNLATYTASNPDDALLVPVDSSIHGPHDLAGKTFATVSLEGMPTLGTYAWLAAQGIDYSTLKYVEMPASATLAAMEQNRVDGGVFYEPFYSAFLATGKVRVLAFPYDAVGRRFANAVLFANANWVSGHRDVVDRFLRASQEASLYVAAHEAESAQLIADFAGVDPATVAKIHHEVRGVTISPADVQPVIDVAAKYKFIPQAFPARDVICPCALRK